MLTVVLGVIFVFLAGLNVVLMIEASRPSDDPRKKARRIQRHRLCGYLFLVLFCSMVVHMTARLSGSQQEWTPRLTAHIALALLLMPLLFVKVLIARRYKSHSTFLLSLGVTIFAGSFLMVALNVLPEMSALFAAGKISSAVRFAVMLAIGVGAGFLMIRRSVIPPRGAPPKADQIFANGSAVRSSLPAGRPEKKQWLLQLTRIYPQTHDTKTFRFLVPRDEVVHARPGQFLTFDWIVDGKQVVRSYSICSSPMQTGFVEITVKRAENGYVSKFLNDQAKVGLLVRARGPSGQFYFDELQHQKMVFIAGGSGITPFVSMLRYIEDKSLSVEITLIYCVRTSKDVIFQQELERLVTSITNFRYVVVVSKPDENWKGCAGHLSRELIESEVTNFGSSTFFLCGPKGMMERAQEILDSLGVAKLQIKTESFGGAPTPPSGSDRDLGGERLEFVRSRRSCERLNGKTLLEIAERNGIDIPSSCRQGQCGTCAVRVLSGCVRMETEDGLAPEQKQQGYVLACVGYAEGPVRLEL